MASDVARFLRAVESTRDESLRWSKHTGDGPDCTWGVVALNYAGEHEWRSDGSRADQTWRGTKSEAHDYAKFLGTLHEGSGVSYSPRPFSSLPASSLSDALHVLRDATLVATGVLGGTFYGKYELASPKVALSYRSAMMSVSGTWPRGSA